MKRLGCRLVVGLQASPAEVRPEVAQQPKGIGNYRIKSRPEVPIRQRTRK